VDIVIKAFLKDDVYLNKMKSLYLHLGNTDLPSFMPAQYVWDVEAALADEARCNTTPIYLYSYIG
jgi:hypothetical protein